MSEQKKKISFAVACVDELRVLCRKNGGML